MSYCNLLILRDRLSVATYDSKLAVFRLDDGFDVVFDSTVETQRMIERGDNYLGSFHNGTSLQELMIKLGIH